MAGGGVLAWHVSERQQRALPDVDEPVVPDGGRLRAVRPAQQRGRRRRRRHGAEGQRAGVRDGPGVGHQPDVARAGRARRAGTPRRPDPRDRAADGAAGRDAAPRHRARCATVARRWCWRWSRTAPASAGSSAVRRDFVANVSHELKTPVGAIKLLAEAVCDAADDPDAVRRFAGRMLTESDRLSRLVQQIIELSRLQDDDPLDAPVVVPGRRRRRGGRRRVGHRRQRAATSRSSPAASTA